MKLDDLLLWPQGTPWLVLAPLAWAALLLLDRLRGRRLARVLGRRARALAAELSPARRRLGSHLFAAALLCGLVAILQPAAGEGGGALERRGADIVVCLDVSRSMLARDLSPDRLGRARAAIAALASHAQGDRLGLVAFAGEARLVSPLTRDANAYRELLQATDTLSVPRGGTDLGAALDVALAALAGARGDCRAIILVSDGEDLEQRGRRAAEACRKKGVSVDCVGVGTALGSKIPVAGDGGESFLRDREGNEVVSALHAGDLRAIAAASGGAYEDASVSERPLLSLYDERIRPMARKAHEAEERRGRNNAFQWPLLAALLLWLFELGLSERRRP